MSDALRTLDALLQSAAAGPKLFPPNSRYYGQPVTTLTLPDGRIIPYLTRRFVPQPDRFAALKQHIVAHGDRLDNLAAQYFNDPGVFWRICDANRAMRPDELIEVIGRVLRITLPDGVPLAGKGV